MAKTTKKVQPAAAAVAKTKRQSALPPHTAVALNAKQLDSALDECHKLHDRANAVYESSREALWEAMAATYFWWRAMGSTTAAAYPEYLRKKCDEGKIEINEGKGRYFTPVAKLAFRLTEAEDAGRVSKYALVLEFLHEQFKEQLVDVQNPADVARFKSEVVARIRKTGGTVKCQKKQLEFLSKTPEAKLEAEHSEKRRKRIVDQGKEAFLRQSKTLAVVRDQLSLPAAPGLVMLLGRHDGAGKVEVLDLVDSDEVDIDRLIMSTRAYSAEGFDPLVNLLGNGLVLARLLDEQKSVHLVEATAAPDAKSSKREKCRRSVVLRGTPYNDILVSLNRIDVSPVIEIKPLADIGVPVASDLTLNTNDRKALEKLITDIGPRRLYTAKLERPGPKLKSKLVIAFNDGLRDTPFHAHLHPYEHGKNASVCVDESRYALSYVSEIDLSKDQVQQLWAKFFHPYRQTQLKSHKAVQLAFSSSGLHVMGGEAEGEFPFKATLDSNLKSADIALKGTDVVRLVDTLRSFRDLRSVKIRVALDTLIEVSFELFQARYRIFLPALQNNGEYVQRAFFRHRPSFKVIEGRRSGAASPVAHETDARDERAAAELANRRKAG